MTTPLGSHRWAIVAALLSLALGTTAAVATENRPPTAGMVASNEGRGSEKAAEHRRGGLAPEVKFVGVLRDGSRETTGVFLARQLDTLIIQLFWKHWVDNREMHYQRVQLIAPDGAIYQTFTTDIHAFKHDGNPVEIEVPVTGSWIKAHKLFGAWRVDVFLDDEPLAIARQGFTILSSN